MKRAKRGRRRAAQKQRTTEKSLKRDEQAIGARIRFLRQQRDITLEELSDRVGLTKSFVSKVERGLSVPSISTTMKISDGLDMTVSQLLGEESSDKFACLVRKGERRSFMRPGSEVGYNYELLAGPKEFKRMEPYIMRPPLQFQDNRKFEHVGEEFMLVLSGSIMVEIGDTKYELSRGDALYFDAHITHRTKSLGGRYAEVLVVITGGAVARANGK